MAVKALPRVLQDSSHYEWMKLYAQKAGKFGDVLVLRTDGVVEATQVKFSADAMRPGDPRTWQKLLALSKSGTSIFEE